ncbi:MlaC/ttg2D family ABC transporter substrate-binding protein [Aquibaculum arenosum]|uniref:ABC transporter substrate-binding protein n=1 Tax=Aquibaculum arenosum TaxID=3032591 RepID=A0ABT5YKT5_9PROT|nr:ABC transporter substrate-binding protein [Fodinicurvata sp. CAU 1616]MDF2094869.1 ABC transporter substrate-binding protein [Fodinicurvata sp. CAU 1616]
MIPRLFLSLTLLLFTAVPLSAQANEGPDAFLRDFGQRAVEQLSNDSVPFEQREAEFKAMLDEGFDLEAISRFIIARQWRGASEEDQQAFIAVFKDYLSQRFLPLFEEYSGESFATNGVRPDSDNEDLSWVRISFQSPNGQPVNTDWRLRRVNGSYKILDVRAEGASLALTLREEYASVMRQEGGLAGLVTRLEEQVARGAFRPD